MLFHAATFRHREGLRIKVWVNILYSPSNQIVPFDFEGVDFLLRCIGQSHGLPVGTPRHWSQVVGSIQAMLMSHQSFVVHGRISRASWRVDVGNANLDSGIENVIAVDHFKSLQKLFDAVLGTFTRLHDNLDSLVSPVMNEKVKCKGVRQSVAIDPNGRVLRSFLEDFGNCPDRMLFRNIFRSPVVRTRFRREFGQGQINRVGQRCHLFVKPTESQTLLRVVDVFPDFFFVADNVVVIHPGIILRILDAVVVFNGRCHGHKKLLYQYI